MRKPPAVKSARDTAYEYLKSSIVAGELKPDEIIDDAEIAAICGISRTPVREALIQLEKVGLIVAAPRRRPAVAPSRGDDVEQILAPLGALQALAARLAAPAATESDVARMTDINQRIIHAAEASEWAEAAVLDMEFHGVLVQRSENRFLIAEVENLQTLFTRATTLYMRNRGPDQNSVQEHEAIIGAVRKKDGSLAGEATAKNFGRR
ncbi:GntR family transcriptional regulator [Streptomyces sp. NPDC052042]|uniref:GntR family transcriptional regulator n=1 Tax=Streptomyces sp. NPDC052042 TaxID=3365683 RepID=UPI0037D1F8AF